MTRGGMKIVLANPEGYELMPAMDEIAQMQAADSGGSFYVVGSIEGPSRR
jgi:ornithine carbamoyltransferase